MNYPVRVNLNNNKLTAYPKSSHDISKLVKFCNKNNINIIATGGETNRVGGTNPYRNHKNIFINFKYMNKIEQVDHDNLICTAQSGATLFEVQKKSNNKGLLFPVNIAPNDKCTIGGNISTNVGGLQTLRYGNIEDHINGLEVVLSNGDIINFESKLKKDNFGPKLWKLFIGSEGVFGIITKANLKLIPKKKYKTIFLIQISNLIKAINLYKKIRDEYYDNLISYEIIFPIPSSITFKNDNYNLILEVNSNDKENLSKALILMFERYKVKVDKIEKNKTKSNIWKKREDIVYKQNQLNFNHKFDISLPLSNWPIFIKKINKYISQESCYTPYFFGHLGDGNLHCNFKITDDDKTKKKELSNVIFKLVMGLQGSIAAEHGIGTQKLNLLKKYKSKEYYNFLKKLKKHMDVKSIMGRGKLL
jgi:FAD/FMN-containing dehydrogenase